MLGSSELTAVTTIKAISYSGVLIFSDKPTKYTGQSYCYLVLINPVLVGLW